MSVHGSQTKRDFLSVADLSREELRSLLDVAREMKSGALVPNLSGRSLVLLTEKPSLRTRVSLELGMRRMGGDSLTLAPQEVGLGGREPVSDVARVLSRYTDLIAARVNSHSTLKEMAATASVPVVNALSDREHPCQALADLLTITEHVGPLEDVTIAYIGDGNNVAASLALGCALTGAHLHLASPEGYELAPEIMALAAEIAGESGVAPELMRHPLDAVRNANVVYTDVWASMGQEAERERRTQDFTGYQVTPEVMDLAHEGAVFMHDLPAHPGEEIEAGMLEHPQSVVFDQAENRLHAQSTLIAFLLGAIELG